MKSKIYEIKTSLDYEKVCYASLKKIFSVTLFPRILINTQNLIFDKNFAKKLDFECFFTQNYRNFAKKVHFSDFDMGIFFFSKFDKIFVKLVDGNGRAAGSFITNIFDNVMCMSNQKFEEYKNQIDKLYGELDQSKLLHEVVE